MAFNVPGADARTTFVTNAKGEAIALIVHQNGAEMKARRLP